MRYIKDLRKYNVVEEPRFRSTQETFDYSQYHLEEYYKCSQDPIYFLENYYNVFTHDNGYQIIELYDYQKECITSFIEGDKYLLLNMPRQHGKSTIIAAILLWTVLFKRDKFISIVSKTQIGANAILYNISHAYKRLPIFLQQGVESISKTRIYLENGSSINAYSIEDERLRGWQHHLLVIDEVGIINEDIMNNFVESIMPPITASRNAQILITKSFSPRTNTFSEYIESSDSYTTIAGTWRDIPGRDELWRDRTKDIYFHGNEEQFISYYGN